MTVNDPVKIPTFKHPELLEIALTHPDAIDENSNLNSQEKKMRILEHLGIVHLGNSIFSQIVTDYLVIRCSHLGSATRTLLKSDLISCSTLAQFALKLHLEELSQLGRDFDYKDEFEQDHILSEQLEGFVGATYLEFDQDLEHTQNWWVKHLIAESVDQLLIDIFSEFAPSLDWEAEFHPWFGCDRLCKYPQNSEVQIQSAFC